MQSNNSNSSQFNILEQRTKNIFMMFFPLIIAVILQYAVIIMDIIAIVIKNAMSSHKSNSDNTIGIIITRDYKQPMNMAYLSLWQYVVFGIIFGIWFYKAFCSNTSLAKNLKSSIKPKVLLCLIPAGYAAQLLVDGVLVMIRPFFSEAFKEYDKMVTNVTGVNSSWVMLLSVLLAAPIAEEILFRGLIFKYGKKAFPPIAAILLQGLLFGFYHGNIIQGIYAFFMGSILGLIAHRKNSILPCIVLHISINVSLLFVPKELFSTTTSTVITTVVSGIIFICFLVPALIHRPSRQGQEHKPEA